MAECSNVRELLANLRLTQTLIGFLANMRVDRRLDNMGVVQALGGIIPSQPEHIFGGSRNRRIHKLLAIVHDDLCIQHNIDCRFFWVPRALNSVADATAKVCNGDQYCFMLRPGPREFIQCTFGIHTIDRFASRNNIQVPSGRYNSKFYESGAEWLNAFSCNWRLDSAGCLENNWVHPPYSLIGRVCDYAVACRANATIILHTGLLLQVLGG